MPKLSMRTIEHLAKLVTGDNALAPYRGGPALVTFFNRHGSNEVYGPGFPSRWRFAQDQLVAHNGTPAILAILEDIFDPLHFDKELDVHAAVADVNAYLQRDQLEVVVSKLGAKVQSSDGASVSFTNPSLRDAPTSFEFIRENIDKCEQKLKGEDCAGAITTARSLCEDVLRAAERRLDTNAPPKYDGDLPKLYKRVRVLFNMDPDTYKERDDIAQVLQGLTSVVAGLSSLSNALGDRHGGRRVRPELRHARLAVNSANTLCAYIVHAYQARSARGL